MRLNVNLEISDATVHGFVYIQARNYRENRNSDAYCDLVSYLEIRRFRRSDNLSFKVVQCSFYNLIVRAECKHATIQLIALLRNLKHGN